MTDLTDRMRTCAAAILAHKESADDPSIVPPWSFSRATQDAADLLVAAAHEIDILTGSIDLGEPMEVIPDARPLHPFAQKIDVDMTPVPDALSDALKRKVEQVVTDAGGTWIGDDLKPIPNASRSPNACPKCDSRANKTVRKKGKSLWLVCPVCDHAWTR